MKLTSGQKQALVRKAMTIIQEKLAKEKQELEKNYKPSKEAIALLNKVKKILEARNAYRDTVKALGFKMCSYNAEIYNCEPCSISISHNGKETIEDYYNNIRDAELRNSYKKVYPQEYEIMDELELQDLDKSFNVDSFLAKYQNL